MLLVFRSIVLALLLVLLFCFSIVLCLLRPMHKDNVYVLARCFAAVTPLLGLRVIIRNLARNQCQPCIFLANHQNNFDLFTLSKVVPKGTVSLGKKSLLWIPLFGIIYWLSGNILIDRNNRSRAVATLSKVARKIKQNRLSLWVFPEGTRSRGRGLLPFKMGAFHTAIATGVPVVPIIASCQSHIRLNRRNNGVVIIELLEPIATDNVAPSQLRDFAAAIHQKMAAKLEQLNIEAAQLMAAPSHHPEV
ncbi:1-acylglycerol-3-phosphate O-acyltransferase [Shewanella fodinae]|uniref:1-acyl-sn-glycerol-3-phosphate acyltransferase n=1 Tax=Shewanella fodinae TaxID=552357 RepID=A0A4R2FMP5_9GAMM|nr:1-acylglycerol-3-phosphate O-acyltransferase [Shewanella fodinae]TCN90623.1 1-acyl-sn-glycerol-3-phosphate acyltransferase [Shewanella fodinae]